MSNNVENVSTGKPKITGAISVAPLGTTLPTTASEELDSAFEGLGYVSEDGLTNGTNMETESIKAWGGDTVLVTLTSKEDTYKFKLIEILRKSVLEFVYGKDNVSGNLDDGLVLKVNSNETPEVSIVIDMIMRGGILKRCVVPSCRVSNVDDIEYVDDDATGYDTTVSCMPDEEGNTHYEYIQKPASTPTPDPDPDPNPNPDPENPDEPVTPGE
jgi:hypothetical protein